MFDGESFLSIATDLCTSTDEHCLRTSTGRSYYATFWVARGWALRKAPEREREFRGLGAHQAVNDFVRSSKNPTIRTAGDGITDLRRARNSADYHEIYEATNMDLPNDAKFLVLLARDVIAELK